jgi:diaminopimelate decarboxylase
LGALQGRSEKIIVEPGRVLVGNAGVLLTKVEYLKPGEEKHFAIVDAAMNDLMRPALYDAYHAIQSVQRSNIATQKYEVVGPICETGDFLGHARELALHQGSLLVLMSAGAYGMSMSSNYNTRPRAAEVMVDGKAAHLIRERETVQQLFAGEKIIV